MQNYAILAMRVLHETDDNEVSRFVTHIEIDVILSYRSSDMT